MTTLAQRVEIDGRSYYLVHRNLARQYAPAVARQLEDMVAGRSTPSEPAAAPSSATTLDDVERELILSTLQKTENNKAKAARVLGLDVKTIRNKLRSYGLYASTPAPMHEFPQDGVRP